MGFNRSACSAVIAIVFTISAGCDSESDPTPASAQTSPSGASLDDMPAPRFWSQYEKADWGSVQGVAGEDAVDAFSHVSRFVDRCDEGRSPTVELFCDAHGRVFDRDGNMLQLSVEGWKGLHDLLAKSPDGKGAMRAMPAGAFDHADGQGEVARWAYSYTAGPEHTIVLEVVKPVENSSGG